MKILHSKIFIWILKYELTPEYISEKQNQQQDPDHSYNLNEKNQVIERKMEQMNKEAKMKMKMQMISSQRQDSIDQIESLWCIETINKSIT